MTTLLDLLLEHVAAAGVIVAPDERVAAALAPHHTVHRGLGDAAPGRADAVVLAADELSRAGEQAEGLIAEAADTLRPGGLLVATARNRIHAAATGTRLDGLRGFRHDELDRALGHRGFTVDLLCAPGAAAALRGEEFGEALHTPIDFDLDRCVGLLDAAPRMLIVGRSPVDSAARGERFFSTLPRKVVAASVICRDGDGRVLVVFDSFKRYWTLPGGVVDADEDPRTAAERETWEEAGIRVRAGAALGLFAASWPDRVVCVYAAVPADGGTPVPSPVHTHEIGDAAWVDLEEAVERVAPNVAFQIRRCLESPGGTWRQ